MKSIWLDPPVTIGFSTTFLKNKTKKLQLSYQHGPPLVRSRFFTRPKLSRRSWGRRRRGGGRRRRGKKSGKAPASPALAPSYSATPRWWRGAREQEREDLEEQTQESKRSSPTCRTATTVKETKAAVNCTIQKGRRSDGKNRGAVAVTR